MTDYKLVPIDPTPEMVEAAEDAYMPFGDMELAIRMAVLAAPAVQGEPVAYAVFASNGNIRIWCADPIQVETLRQQYGEALQPLYTAPQPAEQQREVEPWIPVSERLPEPHEIIRFYPPINEGTAYSVDWGWFEGGQCLYQEYDDRHGSLTRVHVHVTHWQPITEPEEPGHD